MALHKNALQYSSLAVWMRGKCFVWFYIKMCDKIKKRIEKYWPRGGRQCILESGIKEIKNGFGF